MATRTLGMLADEADFIGEALIRCSSELEEDIPTISPESLTRMLRGCAYMLERVTDDMRTLDEQVVDDIIRGETR